MVYGIVGIDMIAGLRLGSLRIVQPVHSRGGRSSSQAEHDKLARAISGDRLDLLADRRKELSREKIARASIENNGRITLRLLRKLCSSSESGGTGAFEIRHG